MKNEEVAAFFDGIADLLELKNDNTFRIRAYRRAAQNVRSLSEDIEKVLDEGRLEELPGIGKDLADKIKEILTTGRLKAYEILQKKVPRIKLEMMSIPGVGPKKANVLYDELKVRSIGDLEIKAKAHKLSAIGGMGEKTEANILRGIDLVRRHSERTPLKDAMDIAASFTDGLEKAGCAKRIAISGSLRRMKDTVRDIDILVSSDNPAAVMNSFVKLPMVADVTAFGGTKSSILTKDRVQVDIRVIDNGSFGAALVYFTGSKAHNVRLRNIAKRSGLKLNEYGIFNIKTGKPLAGRSEEDIYKALNLNFIPPELREDRGEIEASLAGELPALVKLKDINGDLHAHSDWTDGMQTLEELAISARKMGYQYIAVTDHSKSLRISNGLSEKQALNRIDRIEKLNSKLKGIRLLTGTEIEIKDDGSLDYDDEILKKFDIVVAAIHSGFKQSSEKLTQRILRAIDNKYVHIIAHPSGRLMGSRDPFKVDFERIFDAACERGVCMEINASRLRLDLDDIGARAAKEAGVKIALGTDAHAFEHFNYMELGVAIARRGWLTKKDIINTMDLSDLLKFLHK